MKFVCKRDDLNRAISIVQRAMPSKTTMNILEGIFVSATGGTLRLFCNDLVVYIESLVPADIQKEGELVFPGRLFSEIARKLPEGPVKIEAVNNSIKIESQNTLMTLQGMDASEYPKIPTNDGTHPLEIKQRVFKEMILQTNFAVAVDDSKPILTGELIEVQGDTVNMVALDGYRLAIRSEKLLKESTSASIVIPGRSLIEIAKLFEESDASASILIGDNLAIVDIGMSRIITRLLDGEYIKYKQVLPAEKATRVRVQSEELRSSVERASLLAREGRNNLIKIHIGDDKLTISANSEIGSVIEEVDVYMEGKELDIAFNARYLADVLKVINDEEILLDFNSSLSPCVVRPVSGDSFLYLIQPVRIYM